MARQIIVRPAEASDIESWLALWHGYCAALDVAVGDAVTQGVWRRILAPDEPIWCLLACRTGGERLGFANYVLHPHSWSLRPVCYLEDLFVAGESRGSGVGQTLIEALMSLGKTHGWRRIYWHTHENNYRARTLYDRLAPRTDYVRYDVEL